MVLKRVILVVALILLFTGGGAIYSEEVAPDWEQLVEQIEDAIEYAEWTMEELLFIMEELEQYLALLKEHKGEPQKPSGLIMNLALGQQAEQSSLGYGGLPERAVDGNTDGHYHAGSVSHTGYEQSPWWQVDLGVSGFIATIDLWNRVEDANRAINVYVLVAENPFIDGGLDAVLNQPDVFVTFIPEQLERPTTINVNRWGRYVRVQLQDSQYLHLAEVEVWGYR